jgi:hypothetical protein
VDRGAEAAVVVPGVVADPGAVDLAVADLAVVVRGVVGQAMEAQDSEYHRPGHRQEQDW